jgi:hypothetical protein
MMPAAWNTPLQPNLPNSPVFGGMKVPVGAVDDPHAEADEQDDHRDLDRHDHGIEARRLVNADVAEAGDGRDDEYRRQVDDRAGAHDLEMSCALGERRVGERVRQVETQLFDQADHVSRPADGDRTRREQVFEDQVPADEPGDAFAERCVRVGIRAAGDRDHRRELGVAEACQRASEAGDEERDDESGTRVIRGGCAREHEDAGADDGAYA